MIEVLENALQLAVLLLCALYAGLMTYKKRSRGWLLMAGFYLCYAMGDAYWLLYLSLRGYTPQFSFIADPSWYTSGLFLCILLRLSLGEARDRSLLPWLMPVFCAASGLFYMQWGKYLSNAVAAFVFGWLGYLTVCCLRRPGADRGFPASVLAHILLLYVVWYCSCFWWSDTWANPYFWFDILHTASFIWMLLAYRKAAAT